MIWRRYWAYDEDSAEEYFKNHVIRTGLESLIINIKYIVNGTDNYDRLCVTDEKTYWRIY
jgi:hypothetical protein